METSGRKRATEHGGAAMDAGKGIENKNNVIEQSTSSKVLEKVGNVIVSINEANHGSVDH
ncbi:hypothetical protein HanRHA438_Chr14g0656241 [Helianthus annuus]|nr:hypothetical protein HanIR_Chr14g0700291 [Helianthus annuus]KAJ0853873.1 hypothetical protein HanRHA438_Chr14g0656241 [Helianthus annuus]